MEPNPFARLLWLVVALMALLLAVVWLGERL